ncbi:unnamed protein product [Closterium sp. NIES-65]|nr:unnamed protein product [Closterium sp. NIES-65]
MLRRPQVISHGEGGALEVRIPQRSTTRTAPAGRSPPSIPSQQAPPAHSLPCKRLTSGRVASHLSSSHPLPHLLSLPNSLPIPPSALPARLSCKLASVHRPISPFPTPNSPLLAPLLNPPSRPTPPYPTPPCVPSRDLPLQALFTVPAALLLPFTICIFFVFIVSAILAQGWMRGATHTETIVLSPDFFTITITSLGADKHRQGSTPWVRAIMVRDLDSPQPPPLPVHSIAAHGPFPPAPAMQSPDAAASPRVRAGFQPELVCAIVDAQQEYHFGKLLKNAEKYWVVGELSHDLHTMRMHPVQLNV